MAPRVAFSTDQIRDKARKDLLNLLEGVSIRRCPRPRPAPPAPGSEIRGGGCLTDGNLSRCAARRISFSSVVLLDRLASWSRSQSCRSTVSTSSSSWRTRMPTRAREMSSSSRGASVRGTPKASQVMLFLHLDAPATPTHRAYIFDVRACPKRSVTAIKPRY